MEISDRVAVLDFGRKIAKGTPEEVQRNPGDSRPISAGSTGMLKSKISGFPMAESRC